MQEPFDLLEEVNSLGVGQNLPCDEDDAVSKASENKTIRIAFASLILAALTFAYGVTRDYFVKKSTDARFANVQTVLRLLTGAVAPQLQKAVDDSLASAISTPDRSAGDKIAFAQTAIEQLNDAKAPLPADALKKTGDQLNAISQLHTDLPETWVTIGDFITYRSQAIRGWEETNLPLCDNQFHRFKTLEPITPGEHTIEHTPIELHDCKFILDSTDATRNLSPDLSISDVVFTHCAIFYNGGPIVLVPLKVVKSQPAKLVGHATFKDCVFIVSFRAPPPAEGILFARKLLSAENGTFDINFNQS